ncbi:hypothetical protein ULMS_08360 [Patiriisocius marinistellae]|uniref:Glycoside hydrolase n=1 Tax=Patiriisocius marinistellae TaxID=2494560 RepID=A0A5J4FVP3_9FLAO|nr:hypothetical protein ULMS_08360 [Patiriisocius marinistellae]
MNGISFVASGEATTQEHLDAVVNINANYAAVMPFGFIRNLETPVLQYNTDRQWFGERAEGVKQYIEMLHKNNIAVMVKPQIWISRGEFTGYLKMNTEKDWKVLEESYLDFILIYARLAEQMNTEMYCIGTELEQFIIQRPKFWNHLITEVKKVYKGKLTYAANWDEYKRVPFWGQLDYIGVDAYFPISKEKTPTIEQAKSGLQKWKIEMQQISEIHKKPILFTEYGYRSVDFAGKEPWLSSREMKSINMYAQTNLTKALIEEMYPEPWFAGGFIWKWFIEHNKVGGLENNQFTPQNKPVEQELKKYFKLYGN